MILVDISHARIQVYASLEIVLVDVSLEKNSNK